MQPPTPPNNNDFEQYKAYAEFSMKREHDELEEKKLAEITRKKAERDKFLLDNFYESLYNGKKK